MGKIHYSKELLESLVGQNVSMLGVLKSLGLRPGGGSQMTLTKRVLDYGISISHFKGRGYKFSIENREAINTRLRGSRLEPEKRARFVFSDARARDAKYGREFGLTKPFVTSEIAKPCGYCGDTTNQMTLDRKDNSLGYSDTNCVASCLRCNLLRRDMPYGAWLMLARHLKEIREEGLFGAWLYKGR